MRVLLIAYHYPPDAAVGAFRAGNVAAALRAAGHEVVVIAGPGTTGRDEGADGVHRVRPVIDPRRFLARTRRDPAIPADAGAGDPTPEQVWTPPAKTPGWKRLIGALLWLPDDRQGWIPAVVAKAIRMRGRFDLLYTTGPPFSGHLAGLVLRPLLRARWAAEFRDPWTDTPGKPEHVRTRATDSFERWLEGRCLRAADHVITVTDATGELLRRRLGPGRADKVSVVRNGIDTLAAAPSPGTPSHRIVYVGNIYHQRDPRPFFEAVASLARAGRLPADTSVQFIGDCNAYRGVDLVRYVDAIGIGDRVRFLDPMPHSECQRMVADADVLLLLAQDQPAQVPNKLYEYLGARKPILAYVDRAGESAQLLESAGGHHLVYGGDDDDAGARALERALGGVPPSHSREEEEFLENLLTARQMERLVATLNGKAS